MKQIVIKGGYKAKPEVIDIGVCLLAGYSHGTASYGFMYVVEIDENNKTIQCDAKRNSKDIEE